MLKWCINIFLFNIYRQSFAILGAVMLVMSLLQFTSTHKYLKKGASAKIFWVDSFGGNLIFFRNGQLLTKSGRDVGQSRCRNRKRISGNQKTAVNHPGMNGWYGPNTFFKLQMVDKGLYVLFGRYRHIVVA